MVFNKAYKKVTRDTIPDDRDSVSDVFDVTTTNVILGFLPFVSFQPTRQIIWNFLPMIFSMRKHAGGTYQGFIDCYQSPT